MMPTQTPGSEYGSEMSRRLAWIRSDSPEGMMKLLAMRIQECQERSTPGTVGRDSDTASPERRRQRSGVTGSTASEADRRASEMMRNAPLPLTHLHRFTPVPYSTDGIRAQIARSVGAHGHLK